MPLNKETKPTYFSDILRIFNNLCTFKFCQTPCTIKHVLLESKVFNDTRKHYFHANTMKDLFENIHMDDVFVVLERDRVVPENIDLITIL